MAGWAPLEKLLEEEVIQRTEEGCNTTGFAGRVAAAKGDNTALMELYHQLQKLPIRGDFPYREPDDLETILSLSTGRGKDDAGIHFDKDTLADKLYGAWLGRCIGCALGKPFEKDPFVDGNKQGGGWVHIQRWLKGADACPLRDYVPGSSTAAEEYGLVIQWPDSYKENIRFMETDDDIRYLVLGLLIAEQFGNNFTPDQVAAIWQQYLPAKLCCTAELQAYINSLNTEIADPEERWSYIRNYLNPYREWIGAQIRVDQYAYVNAGHPLTAAKAAFQDARFSHVKNGVYGAMFIAAMIAAAFTTNDPLVCIQAGLSVIPTTSRLYGDIQLALKLADAAKTEENLFAALWKAFGHYNWVHTNNNAAACAAVLAFGKGDFTRTVAAAVSCGWDTDCNGATIGSVMGAMYGAKAIPEHWVKPLNDTLYSFIPGFHPIAISECARRSHAVYDRLHPAK